MIDTKQYVIKQIEERDIRFLRLWFTDLFGQLKNVAITPSDIDEAFDEGIGFDGSAIEGLAPIEDSDMLLHPDPSSFQLLPWRPKNNAVARMFCDVRTPEGEPVEGDGRRVLVKMLDKAADMGYSVNVGNAMEYFYFESPESAAPVDHGTYFDIAPLDTAANLRRDTVLMLEQIGIPVEYSHHEASPSQQEIDLRFCDALTAADSVITARIAIKEVASAHGVHASFMPKPIEGEAGSGLHVHMSLFGEDGENAFYDAEDPDGWSLSTVGKQFLAGLLKYAPEYMLVTNQYVNSYKRLVPGFDAPMYAAWGRSNRSTMIRVPHYKPNKPQATRIEIRSVDSAANPYLTYAVLLGAGLKGIEEGLELPAPIASNIFEMSKAERNELGLKPLPTDLAWAMDNFSKSDLMKEVLGDYVFSFLLSAKREEWESYRAHVTSWELKRYLAKL